MLLLFKPIFLYDMYFFLEDKFSQLLYSSNHISYTLMHIRDFTCFFSMRPNIFLGVSEGSAQYRKWYYELMIDQVDHFVTSEPSHLRVGWANSKGYAPYPGGGEGWGGNGVGDDLYSFGFDGLHLWSGELEEINCESVCAVVTVVI